jgi:hypothetical protein
MMRFLLVTLVFCLPRLSVAATPSEMEKEAGLLFEKARAANDRDGIVRACSMWEDAFKLSGRLEIKYALGVCYTEAERGPEAEAAYREFLAYAPASEKRQIAEQALAQLAEERRAQERSQPAKFVVDAPLPVALSQPLVVLEPSSLSRRAWWIGGSVLGGLVLGAVAGGFFIRNGGVNRLGEAEQIP